MVDAKHIMQHLDKKKAEGVVNESQQQIVYADRIILNKMDLVKDRRRLRPSNAASLTLISLPRSSSATKSVIDVNWVLNICAFDPRRILEMDPEFLSRDVKTKHDGLVRSASAVLRGKIDLASSGSGLAISCTRMAATSFA